MIHYYRLILQYKGTKYFGWQVQAYGAGSTVQGVLNKSLEKVSKAPAKSLGAGRTDAGVHALGQVAKVGIELAIMPEMLLRALNANLPDDIRIIHAEASDESFLPTIQARSKEYQYRFTCLRMPTAFQNDLVANYPFEVDIEKMRQACGLLLGRHDFTNFFCEGTEVSSYVREIYECEIHEAKQGQWEMLPAHYIFRVVGSGFLKQMVRLLMGALWNVGRGKISLAQFKAALSSEKTQRLGPVAPPQGLYMVCVKY